MTYYTILSIVLSGSFALADVFNNTPVVNPVGAQQIDVSIPKSLIRKGSVTHTVKLSDPMFELEKDSNFRRSWIDNHLLRTMNFFDTKTDFKNIYQQLKKSAGNYTSKIKVITDNETFFMKQFPGEQQARLCHSLNKIENCSINPNELGFKKGHWSISSFDLSPKRTKIAVNFTLYGNDANHESRIYKLPSMTYLMTMPHTLSKWYDEDEALLYQQGDSFAGGKPTKFYRFNMVTGNKVTARYGPAQVVAYDNGKKFYCDRLFRGENNLREAQGNSIVEVKAQKKSTIFQCLGFYQDLAIMVGTCERSYCLYSVNLKDSIKQAKLTYNIGFYNKFPSLRMQGKYLIIGEKGNYGTALKFKKLELESSGLVLNIDELTLPKLTTAWKSQSSNGDILFSINSFRLPTSIWKWNLKDNTLESVVEQKSKIDTSGIVIQTLKTKSKDGTTIPFYVMRLRKTRGPAPTLLRGYGGFGVSMTPSFDHDLISFVKMGGVYVLASLRGGGEFGIAWRTQGRLYKKQNTFDDFIAVAEELHKQKISTKDTLTINGQSNGGLLVGAVANQRPDLFAAAIPEVGVMDMVLSARVDRKYGLGWSSEYGARDKVPSLANIMKYSPYHNIRPRQKMPFIYVVTAEHDDRVSPSHSFKYAGNLQHNGYEDSMLLNVRPNIGHGYGMRADDEIEKNARIFALVFWAAKTPRRSVK